MDTRKESHEASALPTFVWHLAGLTVRPGVQRLLDRLAGVPVAVYDAAWNLIVASAPYDALMGETSVLKGNERNGVWRNLVGNGSRAQQTPEQHADQAARLVADLRRLINDLRVASTHFAELWQAGPGPAPVDPSRRKVIAHPTVGLIALECDTLVVASDNLRIMIYTAEPGTDDAQRLELATVLGTQSLTG